MSSGRLSPAKSVLQLLVAVSTAAVAACSPADVTIVLGYQGMSVTLRPLRRLAWEIPTGTFNKERRLSTRSPRFVFRIPEPPDWLGAIEYLSLRR